MLHFPSPRCRSHPALPGCGRLPYRQGPNTSLLTWVGPTCCAKACPHHAWSRRSQLVFGHLEGAKGLLRIGRGGELLAREGGCQRIGAKVRARLGGSDRKGGVWGKRGAGGL